MRTDKNCRYCQTDMVRSESGALIVCMCEKAEREWVLSMEKESLKKRISEISKEISDMRECSAKAKSTKGCGETIRLHPKVKAKCGEYIMSWDREVYCDNCESSKVKETSK